MAFSKAGKYWYKEDSWQDYKKVPWLSINHSSRRKIMKHLIPKPDRCPGCGTPGDDKLPDWIAYTPQGPVKIPGGHGLERVLILCNRSGNLLSDPDDWYWSCRKCEGKAAREACRNPPHIHIKK